MSKVATVPLSAIDSALIEANVTDTVIEKLYSDYDGLKLQNLTDKEGYILISEARKNVKAIRIIAEKTCKAGREESNRISKLWIEKEKELVGRISPLEEKLSAEEKKFEAEENRIKEEKRRRQEQNLFTRQLQLTKMGA